MNRLTNLILSFFELIEAEGRLFRNQTQTMLRGIVILFFAGVLLSSAALMACYGIFLYLISLMGAPAAALLTALLLAILGLLCIKSGLNQEKRQDMGTAVQKNDSENAKVNENISSENSSSQKSEGARQNV